MSTVASIANCTVTVKRPTAYLVDPEAVAASHVVDRQPPTPGPVQVEITGTPTGTVTISGTVDGAADTETLTWAGAPGIRVTAKSFSAVSEVTPSMSGGTLLSARSVSPGGAPQTVLKAVVSGRPAHRHMRGEQRFPMMAPGQEGKEGATFRIQYEDSWAPARGDIIVVDGSGDTYEVSGAPRSYGDFAPDHWRFSTDLQMGRV